MSFNVFYVANICSAERFNSLFRLKHIKQLPQTQKYHSLLIQGLMQNEVNVQVVSHLPYDRKSIVSKYIRSDYDSEDGVLYNYTSYIHIPFLKQITLFLSTFYKLFVSIDSKLTNIIVCDGVYYPESLASIIVGKLKRIKVLGIFTDMPGYTSNANIQMHSIVKQFFYKAYRYISKDYINKFDCYLFLSPYMKDVVDLKLKPFIVLEGHADIKVKSTLMKVDKKFDNRTLIYAGGLHREYGVEMLVKSFVKINDKSWTLLLYGEGNYKDEIIKISMDFVNVKYNGFISNENVLRVLKRSHLIVNPRFINQGFVKYSFPSKIIEAMSTGTPLLTTKLPCIPNEYDNFLFYIENDSEDFFVAKLREIMMKDLTELEDFGLKAQSFVLEYKNNIVQGAKLHSFIKSVL